MPGAEPSRSTHRNSGKQKGSSKTGKSTLWEAFTNNLAVGSELGPNGTWQMVNHKARGWRSQPSGDTASIASDRSNGSRGATRSVNDGNGFAEGVHAAGVLPGNAHPDSVHQDSVHQGSVPQDINGRRQPSGDTASVASGKSNKSTGTRRSVNNGSGSTRSVHPGPGSGSQDTAGGGQAVGDTASVTSRKSSKSSKSSKSKRSVRSAKSNRSTQSKHSVRSAKSSHSTGTQRNVDNGNGSAGGELPRSVHQDSGGGGGQAGAEGLGEEEGHDRREDHDGGEVGGGKADGGTEVIGEAHAGHGAVTDAIAYAGTSDAEHAHAGPGNDDTDERDLSGHSGEGCAVEDDNAGTGERGILKERDGDGNGEENTCRTIVVWKREMEMSRSLPCIHQLPMHNVLYYVTVRKDKEGERWVV